MIFEFFIFHLNPRSNFTNNIISKNEDQNILNIIKIISLNKISINKELIIVIQNVMNDEMNLTFLFLNQFAISIEDLRNLRNIN